MNRIREDMPRSRSKREMHRGREQVRRAGTDRQVDGLREEMRRTRSDGLVNRCRRHMAWTRSDRQVHAARRENAADGRNVARPIVSGISIARQDGVSGEQDVQQHGIDHAGCGHANIALQCRDGSLGFWTKNAINRPGVVAQNEQGCLN